MSMEDRFGRAGRDTAAGASRERVEHEAEHLHLEQETQRIHAEQAAEAAERSDAPLERPWWKFWSR
jgi:hypothetical protein